MLFRPDRVLRDVDTAANAGGKGTPAPGPNPQATTPGQASPLDKPTQTTRDLRAGRAPRSPNYPEEAEVTGVTNAEAEHLRIAQSKQREASLAAVNAAVEESIALDEKAAFEGEAQRLADFQGEMKELEQAALKSALNQAAQVQKLGREIGNMYPRPGRLFQDSSAAATWGAAMSLAAASFQSSRTGGPNAALGIIQQAIQQDIAAQEIEYDAKKTELGAAQTVYQELRQAYGDAQQAKSAQSAILMEAARHRLDAAARMAKTKMVMTPGGPANHFQVQAAITNEKLIQESNAELVKMAEISYRMTAAGAANTAEKRLAELLGRNPARLEAVLGGKKDLASLAQGAEVARQQSLAEAKRAEQRAKQSGATADVAASVADQAAEAAQAPPASAPAGDVTDTGDVGPARDQQVAALLEDASLENQMDFMRRRNKLTDETAQEFLGSLATGRTGAEGKPGMSPAAMAELFEAEARTLDSEPLGGQRAAELRQAAEQLRALKQAVVASAEEGAGFEQQERSTRETAGIDKALPGVRAAMNEGWSKAFGGEGGMAARNQDARVATVAAASELTGNEGRLVRSSLRDAIPLDAYEYAPGPNEPWSEERSPISSGCSRPWEEHSTPTEEWGTWVAATSTFPTQALTKWNGTRTPVGY